MTQRLISYMTPGFPASLFERIAEHLEVELHFDSSRSGPAANDDPFADGTFDLGWICSTSFVDLSLRATSPSVQLVGVAWVPEDPDAQGRPVYFSDIVVPRDSDIQTLDELAGGRIGCNDPISLSGHHALRFEIAEHGGDPDAFADLVFTGGHDASLDAVVARELDGAVIDSVVRTRRTRTDLDVASLRVIKRLGPWPVQPLVARADMATDQLFEFAAALIGANNDPAMRAELQAAALTQFVAVGPDHYDAVHRAMSATT